MKFQQLFFLIHCLHAVFIWPAYSADMPKVGLVAPLSGPFAPLGKQMSHGVKTAAKATGVIYIEQDEVCTAAGGEAAARALIAHSVNIAIGFTCFESLNAALPILRDAGISTITTGVRANHLTDDNAKTKYLLYRLGPRQDMEVAAITHLLVNRWRNQNFALIDDGTAHARNSAEQIRFALSDAGLEPILTDTFRPELENQLSFVQRLQKAGASHLFIGGEIEDALIISKTAKGQVEIAISEAVTPNAIIQGVGSILSVAIPEYRLEQKAAQASVALQMIGVEPDNYALFAYAAIEIAATIPNVNENIAKHLSSSNFQTVIGTITFDEKGDVTTNPFIPVTLKNGKFVPVSHSLK